MKKLLYIYDGQIIKNPANNQATLTSGDNSMEEPIEETEYDTMLVCQTQNNISNIIDNQIKKIIIRDYFYFPLDFLPNNLLYLELCLHESYNFNLDNLPTNLLCLRLICPNINTTLEYLPNSIKYLELNCKFTSDLSLLPYGIEELVIHLDNLDYDLNNLPNSIKKLSIGSGIQKKITKWPEQLEVLFLSDYNFELENLPNITDLRILTNDTYDFPIVNLPDSIKLLYIGGYNLPISKLPKNLNFLQIKKSDNQELIILDPDFDHSKIVNDIFQRDQSLQFVYNSGMF